jgi:HK97 gp10 family phage protein
MADEFALKGVDRAVAKLRALPAKMRLRVLKSAMRKGANVVKAAAVAGAKQIDDPQTSEQIAKNITVQFSSRESKKQNAVVFKVGVRGGARQFANTRANRRKSRVGQTYKTAGDKSNPGGDTWYWRFIELGTSSVAARPFLQPALANNVQSATDAVVAEANTRLDRMDQDAGLT